MTAPSKPGPTRQGPTRPARSLVPLFHLDMLVALFPPVHWLVADPARAILGVPASVWYIGVVQLAVIITIVLAYQRDPDRARKP